MTAPALVKTPRYYLGRIASQMRTQIRRRLPVASRPRPAGRRNDAPHWVVCFYGVDRSLAYTAWGLMRHVFRPLERAGVRVTVVAHFNRIDSLPAGYSGEERVDFTRDRIALLNPDVLWVEPQQDAAIAAEMQALDGIPWSNRAPRWANSKKYLAHQLHSLSRVHELIGMAGLGGADVFAALRPDLQFLDDLDVAGIQRRLMSGEVDFISPDWQKWGGLNDRIGFMHAGALQPVMLRRSQMGPFAAAHGYIQSEPLLRFAVEAAGLRVGFTSLRAERVRGNGRVWFERFEPQ